MAEEKPVILRIHLNYIFGYFIGIMGPRLVLGVGVPHNIVAIYVNDERTQTKAKKIHA